MEVARRADPAGGRGISHGTTGEAPTMSENATTTETANHHLGHGIVVGYDGSAASVLALDWAIETARERGRPLTIVHGISTTGTGFPAMDLAQAQPLFERTAREIVADGARRAEKVLEVNQIETQYWLGSAAGQIIEASRDADLVVVGSRGRGRLLGGLLGSTSYAVTAHSHCPVVVVRGPAGEDVEDLPEPSRPDPEHPVLVGSDESPGSQRAVDAAAEVAAQSGARLTIVRVAEPVIPSTWTVIEAGAGGAALEDPDTILGWAREGVEREGERVRRTHPSLDVTTEAVLGDPGSVLAGLGQDAGLVVVGSRGRGGFTGMLLGSVSHRVIHDAVCPVMVVR
ncbi:UspA domain-containing protein [Intrasporangium calvum DSM 43043]|uniref:UspA domain-containing protein n=2 Tax=Intrasporangium calvum TaxID=53358 RepID=E6S7S8_INTC7|nr:UspA domain-containing protein [Intrasporangium calvum DSM 43043]